ncbi:hypothetical protein [Bacillus sp. FJAT-42315]|uniref:hypothetical protein n=1 Tax=Bacillus sp. FJAT-42315 TaxID=2014077 RepID=UPI000C2379B2|nr:hypothetical protein [Bacillus sp. FJAT-42315]
MEKQINPFVTFMQQYDLTTADYSKIFDEHTTTVEYNIGTNINEKIISILRDAPKSIIITGNAGDGKTRICRNVYDELASSEFKGWPSNGMEEFEYKDYKIRIIKDLSELRDEVILDELLKLQKLLQSEQPNTHYLIAANEGKLTYFLTKYSELSLLHDEIIPQFSPMSINVNNNNLQVFNLLHSSSSIYAQKIVKEWNRGENWEMCSNCLKQNQCIIYHNHKSLVEKRTGVRLNRIYRSLDGNHGHMTMRELLIQLAYTHTGGLHCVDVHRADSHELQEQSKKAYYENFFGHNLPNEIFEEISGIQEMRAFDPGYVSDSVIDDFILNGDLSSAEESILHQDLFGKHIDTEYGYYYEELKKYRLNHRSDEDEGKKLTEKWLPRLRRKYYFEFSKPQVIENLVPYRYRKKFLDILKSSDELDLDTKRDLISGLNTYFSKRMVYSASHALYVTSENLYVHEIINFSDITFIVPKSLEEYDRKNSYFIMKIGAIQLNINLITFEYLLRLANGGMFNVLKEDVEILLNNFRNQLIANKTEESSILRILKFNSNLGAFELKEIQIQTDLGDSSPEDEEEDFD